LCARLERRKYLIMGLVSELRRRNVLRMAALYAVAAWLIMQVAEVVVTLAALSDWTGQFVLVLLVIGFPIALAFSWFYELTPEGLALERNVTPGESTTRITGRRMDFIVISLLCAAILVFAYDKWWTPVAQEPSIAVLPFVDMSREKDQQYLADGLSEELTNRLSNLEGLQVFGVRSISLFADASDDHLVIARRMACNFVLDGSIRRSENELRITAKLVDTDEGVQVWSHVFDRPYADIFEIQDEIAAAVAKALSVELGVGHAKARIGSTSNVAAFEQVLRGDSFFDLTLSGLDKALSHYRNAIELDPDYALAWMRIAWYYGAIQYVSDRSDADEYQKLAEKAISRALELAPDSEYVLLTASEAQFMKQNWIEAKRLYDRANAILSRRASSVFPDAVLLNVHVSMLLKLGYMSEQVRLLERVSQGRRLTGLYAHFLPQAYLSAGRIDDALAEVELAFLEPRARPNSSYAGLSAALTLDSPELIRLWSQRVMEYAVPKGREGTKTMLDMLGDRERALAWLHEAYETKPHLDDIVIVWGGYYGDDELVLNAMRRSMDLWFFWMPLTASARETEEFKRIVQENGLVRYWREFGWNDYCSPLGEEDFECH